MSHDLTWSPEGVPRSERFDDIYFTPDGLAESRAVFLAGCGLPQAWAGRRRFTVGELGFGTGLNVLALLDLWRATRPAGALLHVFSVEAFPLRREEAARALTAFPELAEPAVALLARWPAVGRGVERIDFPALGVLLDVAVGEAAAALVEWSGAADAWFLDGFAPSKNPDMWRDEVLDLVAARSAPGARLATFTVAGTVRRGLEARGFTVTRLPGHGRKKQRLEARLAGPAVEDPPAPTVAVVGAGIAGASLSRAFKALGLAPIVVDEAPGSGASGNPAALVSPRLDVGGGAAAQLYAQAWRRAVDLYADTPGAVISRGALRLATGPKDPARFAALATSPLFRADALRPLSPGPAASWLGESSSSEALLLAGAVTVAPEALRAAWLPGDPATRSAGSLERSPGGWRVLDAGGELLCEVDVVCLASGAALDRLGGPDVEPVRGQATWSGPLESGATAATWGGYAVPTAGGGVLFGATHDRGDSDAAPRAEDEERNLRALAARRPRLAEAAAAAGLSSRASVRATTPDRLPLAGELEPGLYVLGGLGGRGFTTAPLLAEHVAALATGAPSPLPRSLAAAVDPRRFQGRPGGRRLAPMPEPQP